MKLSWSGGDVSADRHDAAGDTVVLLAHGAGGTKDTPSMRAYAAGLAAGGIGAVRFNFPYADAGRKSPGSQATNERCYREVAEVVRAEAGRLLLGGRSYGGRIASHIVAAGFPADGLVFLAYPLHPPGKPERLRDAHLREIGVPMLFLQGSRDPFARPDLLASTIEQLPGATLHTLEGGDHGHKVPGRAAAEVTTELVDATLEWVRAL